MSTVMPHPTVPTAGASTPIADYGLLTDCNGSALVDSAGSIDWLCMPRYDSGALFARLLDPDAGHWSIRPTGPFEVERRYLEGTLVIEMTFETQDGVARLTDAMAFPHGQRGHELGLDVPHELLRLVEGLSGTVELEMELAPRPEYGLVKPLFRRTEEGGRTFGGPNQIVVGAGVPVELDEATMRATFTVTGGDEIGFAMRWAPVESRDPAACAPDEVPDRIRDTAEGWRSWEREHDIYEGPHRDAIQVSSRVLNGLTYRPTGAIVAAPTTSLPEDPGGERNWDYRVSWIRDSSLTLEALYVGACTDEAENFISFMTSSAGGRVRGSGLAADHVRRRRRARPVRARAAASARMARLRSRAGGERGLDPDPARRVRRAAELALSVPRAAGGAPSRDPALRRRARRRRRALLDRP